MATDGGWAGEHVPRAVARRPSREVRFRRGVLLRFLLLSVVVFGVAVLTGTLLSGAAPAAPAADRSASAGRPEPVASAPVPEQVFAHSLIYTGSAGLAVSIAGLVMVGRRRRLW